MVSFCLFTGVLALTDAGSEIIAQITATSVPDVGSGNYSVYAHLRMRSRNSDTKSAPSELRYQLGRLM